MDIQSRVVNYYKSNQFIQKYLKGINTKTNEVVLNINGTEKNIPIDVLEGIKDEVSLINYSQTGNIPSVEVPTMDIPTIEETPAATAPVAPTPTSVENVTVTPVVSDNVDLSRETLNDIKILTELKNKDGLDNMLKKFSINPTTGLIDINQAISKVTRNTMNEVEKAIKNHYEFNEDASMYDIEGKLIGTPTTGYSNEDEMIVKSFNNIKVYIDASKMYPEQVNYNEEQISNFMRTYIDKVKEELHGSASTSTEPASNPNPPKAPEVVSEPVTTSPNAGFADIFILTVIILVYAVIIVNLILKLK